MHPGLLLGGVFVCLGDGKATVEALKDMADKRLPVSQG